MAEENILITERKNKIEAWKELGFEGYAKKFDRTHISSEAIEEIKKIELRNPGEIMKSEATQEISMCGRIMNFRDMGKLAFLKIRDIDGDFQICLSKNLLEDDYKTFVKSLDLGDFCGFIGEFFLTKHGEPTLMAAKITPLSKALRPMPEKWEGLKDKESCYRERNLDLISNPETFERFKIRSKVVKEVRKFYEDLGFLEVETAMLQEQAGGAMAKTFKTHHNALDHDFHLRIALELPLKMVCSGGFERVFEIGKCFRNEGTDPSHLQEFTMLEWYAAYIDIEQNKKWNEQMLRKICENVLGTTKVTVLDKDDNPVEIDFGKKFEEHRFPDLLKEHANLDMFTASDNEVREKAKEVGVDQIEGVGRANLLDDIYKKTARPKLIQPTFVLDYPEDLKPLAAPNGDGTASCFQVLIAGWEVINAYGELIDPQIQRDLLERQAAAKAGGDVEAMEVDEVFLKAMEHGFPPMTGQGMGIDRIVALLTGQPNLRDVVLFPNMKPENSETQKLEKTTNLVVAILNTSKIKKDWQALNSIGHLAASYGARKGKNIFYKEYIETKDEKKIPLNTTHAIMIKQSDDNKKLLDLIEKAEKNNLNYEVFTQEMLEFSDDKKVEAYTNVKNLNDLEFLGILLYGKKSQVENLTKNFELLENLGTKSSKSSDKITLSPFDKGGLKQDFKIFEGEFNREKAWEMVKSRCDYGLQRHLAHVGASMEALAIHFGHEDQKDTWYQVGLLHDIDWNQTIEDDSKHCGEETMNYLKANGVSDEICEAVQSHHTIFDIPIDTDLKKSLFASDELSGFSVAVSLMRPTKMMGMNPKSVTKKLKDKRFAAAVSRDDMKTCEKYFNIPVSEFLQILIPAWENIAGDWELK